MAVLSSVIMFYQPAGCCEREKKNPQRYGSLANRLTTKNSYWLRRG